MIFETIEHTTHRAKEWAVKHKTAIIICGGIVVCIGFSAWGNKRINIAEPILKRVFHKTAPVMPHIVKTNIVYSSCEADAPAHEILRRGYIRILPRGWQASRAKIAEALKKGIKLKSGETLVNPCTVRIKCA